MLCPIVFSLLLFLSFFSLSLYLSFFLHIFIHIYALNPLIRKQNTHWRDSLSVHVLWEEIYPKRTFNVSHKVSALWPKHTPLRYFNNEPSALYLYIYSKNCPQLLILPTTVITYSSIAENPFFVCFFFFLEAKVHLHTKQSLLFWVSFNNWRYMVVVVVKNVYTIGTNRNRNRV